MEPTAPVPRCTRLSRWGLILAGLFPCLASLGFHVAGPRPNAAAPPEQRPALAFDQYAVDLGPLEPVSHARGLFRFTNTSHRKVTITTLLPSCGCLKPQLDKLEYAPGETGRFWVHVATAGEQPGPREYTITVRYLDPEPQTVVLSFGFELPPRQVYVSPRAVLVYQFGEESTTKEIVVSDNRLKPLTVTGVECKADFVKAELGETTTDENGVQQTRIDVKVAPVPLGSYDTLVRIHTDDAKFPVLYIPVRVHRQPPMMGLRKASPPKAQTPVEAPQPRSGDSR